MRSRNEPSTDKTVKAVVLVDSYAYYETSGDPSTPRLEAPPADPTAANPTSKGVEIEVSEAELERGAAMKPAALAKAGSKEAKMFLAGPPDTGSDLTELSDDDLRAILQARGRNGEGMSREELLGLVAGTPDNPNSAQA